MNQKNIDPSIFRAYDIRGIANETLTIHAAHEVGKALGTAALSMNQQAFIIGRDGRLSSPNLFDALSSGILTTGCNVIDIGVVATPMLYYATNILETNCGIMITGSHNPKDYNGFKIVMEGKTLKESAIQQLYQCIIHQNFAKGHGILRHDNVRERYLDRITSSVHLKRPLKVIIDCGNGAAGVAAEELYQKLGCDLHALYCEVDGNFPNHHPDPGDPKNLETLIDAVKTERADIGLAFDGDADRLGVVTNEGTIINADRQLMLYAVDMLSRNPDATIVYDVKCTSHLDHVIREHGGNPVMCPTGHSIIKNALLKYEALLGGELSGHMFFKEGWYGFDDALYTGARMLEILANQKQSSEELFKTFPDSINTPELKIHIEEKDKFKFVENFQHKANFNSAKLINIDGVRVEFQNGWGLLRASNTTPCLITRFEADNEEALKKIQTIFKTEILKINDKLSLPF